MTTDNQGVSRELAEKFLTTYCKGSAPVRLAQSYLALLDSSEKDKAEAVAAERERCAQKAKEQHCKHDCCHEGCGEARKIESAIRSGK